MASASRITAPRSRKRDDTEDFPAPMPPASPMTFTRRPSRTARYSTRTLRPMQRVVHVVGWGAVGLFLAGIVGYVLLVVVRGISPPVVPITSTNKLYGYSTGDAVLVDSVDRLLVVGDAAIVNVRGQVRMVGVV